VNDVQTRALGLGDRVEDVPPGARKAVFRELVLLWLGTLLLIRGVVTAQSAGLPEWTLAAVPFLFIYAPVWLCSWRKVDSYAYRIAIPAFRDWRAWADGLWEAGKVIAIILVPFLIGYHLYQTQLFHHAPHWRVPKDAWLLVPYHLFFVAIPEEFFYRGYFQTRLNEVFPRKFVLFGVAFGWPLLIASLFFAFGHSLVVIRWWHFATFFPGLLFGWLREKTGQPLAGALLHAWANVTVTWLDTLYGVI
jgi:membrane protease YdiL (CAAX protease family)